MMGANNSRELDNLAPPATQGHVFADGSPVRSIESRVPIDAVFHNHCASQVALFW